MRNFKWINNRLLGALAFAAIALWAPHASAVQIYNGPVSAGNNTFLGTYNPTTNDFGQVDHAINSTGAFTDTLLFIISPTGQFTTNANFNPDTFISGFQVTLRNATATCTTAGTSCTGVTVGSLIATGVNGISDSRISFLNLSAGTYAIVVTGTATDQPVQWSGQLNTRRIIPEPASMLLFGLGLAGLGFWGRKRLN